jgi:flagellar hook-length control protein FliK
MRWEIERDAPQAEVTGEAPDTWRTTLHLALPRLGEIDAQVKVVGNQVHLHLAMSAAAASDLGQAMPLLQQALADAGLTLHAVQTARQAAGNAGSAGGVGGAGRADAPG